MLTEYNKGENNFPSGIITVLKLGSNIYFILLLKYTHTYIMQK